MLRLVALALALAGAAAECPNACSGHGDCANYDMCKCYRNWQGADCSQRTCPFGLAHVDTPKGDLDSSADSLSGPTTVVIEHSTVYPLGTQEQFPNMSTTAGTVLEDTAHYYMECSNKGICDRKTGECDCFEGYEGSSCQRASCPNDCSGHGTCEHIKTLAAMDFGNIYDLWDAEMTMGCLCDAGFSGPDCSAKDCKYGIDPLYIDDEATARVEAVDYRIFMGDVRGDETTKGTYALKFYDVFGEDYETEPLKIGDNCVDVRNALEGLPNTVIPKDSVRCYERADGRVYDHFSLTFRGNPGYLKQLFVDTYLDGDRSTVYAEDLSAAGAYDPTVQIFNRGLTGEFTDYFATQCRHAYVNVKTATYTGVTELNSGYKMEPLGSSNMGFKLLKQCLGDSDGVVEDNVEVYDWDYGSLPVASGKSMMSSYPHAVKLVQVDPFDDYAGGMYYLTWWEPNNQEFILANFPANNTRDEDNTFAVYTTDGVVERVIADMAIEDQFKQAGTDTDDLSAGNYGIGEINNPTTTNRQDARVTAWFNAYSNVLYTSYDTACETANTYIEPCLDKGDMLFVIDSKYVTDNEFNPNGATVTTRTANVHTEESGNLYTIQKIYKEDPTETTFFVEDRFRIVVDKNLPFPGNTLAHVANLKASMDNETSIGVVNLFKFSPATTGNYDFVSQCSNRGTCDEGLCECFKGYTNDNCDTQSSLAV